LVLVPRDHREEVWLADAEVSGVLEGKERRWRQRRIMTW
jgi:hypothetical protein